MHKESILDFVKIPGVIGVALIQEQSQLYLYIKEQTLDEKKRKVLSRSIIQLITKGPKEFDNFEFQVTEYYVHTYKLNHDLAFLVLTDTHISATNLRALAAKQLKATLQQNVNEALTTFELLTRKIPQIKVVPTAEVETYDLRDYSNTFIELNVTIEQLLNALNHLSQLSSNYLGTKLTANYWQLTRPSCNWLSNFQINRSAEIAFSGVITEPVSDLQHQLIKDWTAAFIKHCSQIIRNLPVIVEQKGLNNREKILLLSNSVKPPDRS